MMVLCYINHNDIPVAKLGAIDVTEIFQMVITNKVSCLVY
jgi:hypothetical protein